MNATDMTVHLDYPVNALVSYHYFAKVDLAPFADGGVRLIGDSGAYSAASLGKPIDRDAFASWGTANRAHLAWIASLDVIGDADATWRNYRYLRYQRGVDVVPTVHYGADPRALDRYADDGVDLVGLGGMVPYQKRPQAMLRWCVQMFRYARDTHPGMRFHGWGVTNRRIVSSLPWWSVDASGAGASWRYGRSDLYDPSTGRIVSFQMDRCSAHRYGDMLRRHYGVDPAAVSWVDTGNMALHVRLGARSLQLREASVRRRFAVTPPVYVGMTGVGPNMHYVASAPANLACLSSTYTSPAIPHRPSVHKEIS